MQGVSHHGNQQTLHPGLLIPRDLSTIQQPHWENEAVEQK